MPDEPMYSDDGTVREATTTGLDAAATGTPAAPATTRSSAEEDVTVDAFAMPPQVAWDTVDSRRDVVLVPLYRYSTTAGDSSVAVKFTPNDGPELNTCSEQFWPGASDGTVTPVMPLLMFRVAGTPPQPCGTHTHIHTRIHTGGTSVNEPFPYYTSAFRAGSH